MLVTLLIVISGSLSLALRSGSDHVAAALHTRRRTALQTAEAGLAAIVGVMNQRPNRRMLVSGRPLSAWSDAADSSQDNSLCLPTHPRTAAALTLGDGHWQALAGAADAQYRLIRVRYSDRLRRRWISSELAGPSITSTDPFNNAGNRMNHLDAPPADDVANDIPNISYIELTVTGRVLENGGELSRATLTREYEVVPKACGRSFHGPAAVHGTDALFADLSIRIFGPPAIRRAEGSHIDLVQSDGATRQTAVICLTAAGRDCLSSGVTCVNDSTPADRRCDGVPVVSLPVIGTAQEPRPPDAAAPAFDPSQTPQALLVQGSYYLRVNAAGSGVEACEPSTSNPPTLTGCRDFADKKGRPHCLLSPINTEADIANVHCNIKNVMINNGEQLIVDTSPVDLNGDGSRDPVKIALHFHGPGARGIEIKPRGVFRHVKCSRSSGATGCDTDATLAEYGDLSILGNQRYNRLKMAGSPSAANQIPLALFVYFSEGEIDLGDGHLRIEGGLWTKELKLDGHVTVVAPPLNLPGADFASSRCGAPPHEPHERCGNDPIEDYGYDFDVEPPQHRFDPARYFFDWMARTTTLVRHANE